MDESVHLVHLKCVQFLISSVAALHMKTVELNLAESLTVILRSTSTSLDI